MLEVTRLAIPEVLVITPRRFADHRGFFTETYNKRALAEIGISLEFVQDNHSLSVDAGTIRGLHFQVEPRAQWKLVRVTRGSIFDVVVDIRKSSSTFGAWISAEISANDGNQILVPAGFAHGLCTLEPNTEVLYKVSDYYSPEHDSCIRWNDPAIGINWPPISTPIVSKKDSESPLLSESTCIF